MTGIIFGIISIFGIMIYLLRIQSSNVKSSNIEAQKLQEIREKLRQQEVPRDFVAIYYLNGEKKIMNSKYNGGLFANDLGEITSDSILKNRVTSQLTKKGATDILVYTIVEW